MVFSVRQAKVDTVAARQTALAFYGRLQKHDFDGAHSMLTRERQQVISGAILAQYMSRFERKHGALAKWEVAEMPTVYGHRVSIFPRYVEESRLMTGTNGTAGAGMLQLKPEDGEWKVSRLSIVP